MNDLLEARAKLAEKFGDSTRIGGKGVARRKVFLIKQKKTLSKAAPTNDNQLIQILKK